MKFSIVAVIAGSLMLSSGSVWATNANKDVVVPPGPVTMSPVKPDTTPKRYDPALYVSARGSFSSDFSVEDYYPKKALSDEVSGRVKLDCLIAGDGALIECEILEEDPVGYGFGEATTAMYVKHFRVDRARLPGVLKPGARMIVSYIWTF
jgi:hypothetical protein